MRAHDGRKVRRRDTFIENVVPVHVFEKGMPLDVFRVSLASAQPASRFTGQKLNHSQSQPKERER